VIVFFYNLVSVGSLTIHTQILPPL